MWSSAAGMIETKASPNTTPDVARTNPEPTAVCAVNVDPFIEPTFVVQVNVSPAMALLFWSYPVAEKI